MKQELDTSHPEYKIQPDTMDFTYHINKMINNFKKVKIHDEFEVSALDFMGRNK